MGYIYSRAMTWITIFIYSNFLLIVNNSFIYGKHTHNTTTTTKPSLPTRAANGSGDGDVDLVKAEAGAIAGVLFGVLVCMGFIAFAGIMYLRKKRERDRQYHRNTKVLKESSQSAGVYMDTTQDCMPQRTRNTGNQGSVYKSLHKGSTLYESDSDDEL